MWGGVIKLFHVPSEQFDLNPVLDSKFVTRVMSYLTVPVFIKLGQSLVLHRDNFLCFKVTCKGPHKFGITNKLCDNAFW
jgi:hypothetical protein